MAKHPLTMIIKTRWWFNPLLKTMLIITAHTGYCWSDDSLELICKYGLKFEVG